MKNNNLNLTFFIFLLLNMSFSYCQFERFKKGKFKIENEDRTYIIERFDDFQIEKIKGIQGSIKYNLKWISDNKYVLLYDSNSLTDKELSEKYSSSTYPITIEFIKVEEGFCYFKATFNGKELYDKILEID